MAEKKVGQWGIKWVVVKVVYLDWKSVGYLAPWLVAK